MSAPTKEKWNKLQEKIVELGNLCEECKLGITTITIVVDNTRVPKITMDTIKEGWNEFTQV